MPPFVVDGTDGKMSLPTVSIFGNFIKNSSVGMGVDVCVGGVWVLVWVWGRCGCGCGCRCGCGCGCGCVGKWVSGFVGVWVCVGGRGISPAPNHGELLLVY